MLELDDDGSVPDVVSFNFTYVEGAFDYTLCSGLSPSMIICMLNTIMI